MSQQITPLFFAKVAHIGMVKREQSYDRKERRYTRLLRDCVFETVLEQDLGEEWQWPIYLFVCEGYSEAVSWIGDQIGPKWEVKNQYGTSLWKGRCWSKREAFFHMMEVCKYPDDEFDIDKTKAQGMTASIVGAALVEMSKQEGK